ncbi:hypothetical protein [Thalassobellus suaedae]|uniref:Uncharacterized protein n=1 Tax=Thalassobellus suaedae TaxID=3074124 RepID=A0ABY9Y503_9FLAO|nr:hypothetical protein RHP49_03335 [Flavobacteriaceae bacterium HL-DH10]
MKYKLKNIALVAEIFGGVAIFISLIFVGFQFKENTKATRSSTATATISAMASWYADIGNNQQSSELFYKFLATPDSIPKKQRIQAIYNLHSMFLIFQNSYFLVKEGTLDASIQESLTVVITGVKNQPGMLYYWQTRKSIFFEEFRSYVDEILQSSDHVSEGIYEAIEEKKTE